MNEQDYPPLPAGVRVGSATYLLMKMWVNADRAQQAERHREELVAYEVTVGNLRAMREQAQPVAWIIPERDGEFHHEHASITAYRMPMPGWVPVYLHPAAPQAQLERKRCEYCDGTGDVTSIDGEWLGACSVCNLAQPGHKPMTDGEKLYAMWHSSDANDLDDFLDGWRHAEAFHGIKEKP